MFGPYNLHLEQVPCMLPLQQLLRPQFERYFMGMGSLILPNASGEHHQPRNLAANSWVKGRKKVTTILPPTSY